MKKVISSFVIALAVSFSAVSPVIYAASDDPVGVAAEADDPAAAADIGEIIDTADDVIEFVNGVLGVIKDVNEYFNGDNNAFEDEIKGVIDDMFVGLVETGVSMLPGGDFINLLLGWLGLNDFSITDYFGQKVADLCDLNEYAMKGFYDDYIFPYYGTVDNFVDHVYTEAGLTSPTIPALPSGNGEAVAAIGEGSVSFISGVLTPIGVYCVNSEICLAFLAVTFGFLGVRFLRRSVGALGRGR